MNITISHYFIGFEKPQRFLPSVHSDRTDLSGCAKNMRLFFNYLTSNLRQRSENHSPVKLLSGPQPTSATLICSIPFLHPLLQQAELPWLCLHMMSVHWEFQSCWNIFHFPYTSPCSKSNSFFQMPFCSHGALLHPDHFSWK